MTGSRVTDVLVAGAGPAGLATALLAARVGFDVRVLDPRVASTGEASPIDKACGEGLMPGAVHTLRSWGVRPTGREFVGIEYHDGGRRAVADFAAGPGLGVRRTSLSSTLLQAVADAGVPVHPGAVRSVEQDGDGVTVNGQRYRYLVAADGLHSPVSRMLGLERGAAGRQRWGQRRHFGLAPWSDRVQVHWSPHGEAYVTPVADDLVGVAVLSSRRIPFAEQLRWFPEIADRVAGSAGGPVRGAGPLRRRTTKRVAGRVLLVGDASGYVDALTGEGIAVSLACAQALVDCLRRGIPQAYEKRWRWASLRYRALTSGVLWASGRPVLRRRIVPAAAALPGVFRGVVGQLAR